MARSVSLKWVSLLAVACAQKGGGTFSNTDTVDANRADQTALQDLDYTQAEEVEEKIPWGHETRGYKALRGIIHAHSIYSHDGCAPDAPPLGSIESLKCENEMRLAPCISGIHFIMQTDHPANVASADFLDALHYRPEEGDAIMKDEEERPLANRVKCPEGSLVPYFYFYLGTEGGKKNMPVALAGPVPQEVFSTGYADQVPLEEAQAAIAKVHALGGVALAAHTEEDDISLQRIVALPLDGIEIYNFHANILKAFENFEALMEIDRFMAPKDALGPVADLAFLTFLQPVKRDVEKFDAAASEVHLVHVAANDVHRNVEVPSICPDGVLPGSFCGNLAEAGYPYFAELLSKGGPIILRDGDRLDSYARSYRWFSNYLLVTSDDPDVMRKTLRRGRAFSAFDGFGMPSGFDFFAMKAGTIYEMGEELHFEEGIVLYVRTPTLQEPPWGIPGVTEYASARLFTRLIAATKTESKVVLAIEGQGMTAAFPVSQPGVFRVECDIIPLHLRPALTNVEHLSEKTFPYIYSNAIFVRE